MEKWKRLLPDIRKRMNIYGIDSDPVSFDAMASKLATRETTRGKGILLYGNVGSGKTARMKFLAHECGFRVFESREFGEFWKGCGGGDYELKNYAMCNIPGWDEVPVGFLDIGIDDLGCEDERYSAYGNAADIMRDMIIPWRYDLFPRFKTHFTTNLTPEGMRERYGERCWSRINEMCAFVPLMHKDRRIE